MDIFFAKSSNGGAVGGVGAGGNAAGSTTVGGAVTRTTPPPPPGLPLLPSAASATGSLTAETGGSNANVTNAPIPSTPTPPETAGIDDDAAARDNNVVTGGRSNTAAESIVTSSSSGHGTVLPPGPYHLSYAPSQAVSSALSSSELPQPHTTPIAHFNTPSTVGTTVASSSSATTTPPPHPSGGSLVDTNLNYIAYAVKGGLIRVLDKTHACRTLLRGHAGHPVSDMGFCNPRSDILATVGGISIVNEKEDKDLIEEEKEARSVSGVVIWRLFRNIDARGESIIANEKLLEIRLAQSNDDDGSKKQVTRMAWHPFNTNLFLLVHGTSATLVESTRLFTTKCAREGHHVCSLTPATMAKSAEEEIKKPNGDQSEQAQKQKNYGQLHLLGHFGNILDACWSSDARYVLTSSDGPDGTVRLWDMRPSSDSSGGAPPGLGTKRSSEKGGPLRAKFDWAITPHPEDGNDRGGVDFFSSRGKAVTRCLFLPGTSRGGGGGGSDSREESGVGPFVTASQRNTIATLWSGWDSSMERPVRLRVLEFAPSASSSGLSLNMAKCTAPVEVWGAGGQKVQQFKPLSRGPFLLFSERDAGYLYSVHLSPFSDSDKTAVAFPAKTGYKFSYIAPYRLLHPVLSWSVSSSQRSNDDDVCDDSNKDGVEVIAGGGHGGVVGGGDGGGGIGMKKWDMCCYCVQTRACQLLKLRPENCIPPTTMNSRDVTLSPEVKIVLENSPEEQEVVAVEEPDDVEEEEGSYELDEEEIEAEKAAAESDDDDDDDDDDVDDHGNEDNGGEVDAVEVEEKEYRTLTGTSASDTSGSSIKPPPATSLPLPTSAPGGLDSQPRLVKTAPSDEQEVSVATLAAGASATPAAESSVSADPLTSGPFANWLGSLAAAPTASAIATQQQPMPPVPPPPGVPLPLSVPLPPPPGGFQKVPLSQGLKPPGLPAATTGKSSLSAPPPPGSLSLHQQTSTSTSSSSSTHGLFLSPAEMTKSASASGSSGNKAIATTASSKKKCLPGPPPGLGGTSNAIVAPPPVAGKTRKGSSKSPPREGRRGKTPPSTRRTKTPPRTNNGGSGGAGTKGPRKSTSAGVVGQGVSGKKGSKSGAATAVGSGGGVKILRREGPATVVDGASVSAASAVSHDVSSSVSTVGSAAPKVPQVEPSDIGECIQRSLSAQFKKQEHAMTAELRKFIQREVQSTILPALSKGISDATERERERTAAAVAAASKEHVEAAVMKATKATSKAVTAEVVSAVSDAVRDPVVVAFQRVMREVMVPAYEATTQEMFRQVSKSVEANIVATAAAASAEQKNKSEETARHLHAATLSMEAMARSIESLSKEVAELRLHIATEAAAPGGQIPQQPSSQPHLVVDHIQVVKEEIASLVQSRQFEAAFTKALSEQVADLAVFACRTADLSSLLQTDPNSLSQPVLLCLMQQLGSKLGQSRVIGSQNSNTSDNDNENVRTEVAWLQEIAVTIDPTDDTIRLHAGEVMRRLVENINAEIARGDESLRRPLQMLLQVVRGIGAV